MIYGRAYCYRCGAACVRYPKGTYDRDTGEENQELVCPTLKCRHDGVHHGYRNWFRHRCKVCGETLPWLGE